MFFTEKGKDMGIFDFLIIVSAFLIGILFLTGHGGVFMKNTRGGKQGQIYDEVRMEKASGIALIILGVLTTIDTFTTGLLAKSLYTVAVLVIFGILIFYIKTKCKK
ncbi:MAG: DUF3784 domain-containing protein [Blautia sp.]|nr:DUF3784 domain-containing protein [Blautia sp.]